MALAPESGLPHSLLGGTSPRNNQLLESSSFPERQHEDEKQSRRSHNPCTTLVSTSSSEILIDVGTASLELQKIFQDDQQFVHLCLLAVESTEIGPVGLQHFLGRFLGQFAVHLHEEASNELERSASRNL